MGAKDADNLVSDSAMGHAYVCPGAQLHTSHYQLAVLQVVKMFSVSLQQECGSNQNATLTSQ